MLEPERHHSNTPDCDFFLDRAKPSYIGGWLEMVNARLYGYWGSLTEGLRTGQPQNESKTTPGAGLFDSLYKDPDTLRLFVQGMTGISLQTAQAIAQKFHWKEYKTFVDVGGAQGALPVQVARAHGHLTGGVFDLPAVEPLFQEFVASCGLKDRLHFQAGDFFADPLPTADVIVMGHILHDWDMQQKRTLIAKSFAALPQGGALQLYLRGPDRSTTAAKTPLAFSYESQYANRNFRGFTILERTVASGSERRAFQETRVEHLLGPDSMVIGIKGQSRIAEIVDVETYLSRSC